MLSFINRLSFFVLVIFLSGAAFSETARAKIDKGDFFSFDQPDEMVPITLLENPLLYDPGIATVPNGVWLAWLEFKPGSGDQLWMGLRTTDGKWLKKRKVSSVEGDFANPTPSVDSLGRLWLSYETAKSSNWHVVVEQTSDANLEKRETTSFPGINHSVATAPDGSLVVVCQQEIDGRFHLVGTRLSNDERNFQSRWLGDILTSGNSWHPSVAITSDNAIHAICDAYDGESYNVLLPFFEANSKRPLTIASTPAFEANAQIAAGRDGKVWIAWEEDGENWGKAYAVESTPGDRTTRKMSDNKGPLHRFRRLRFAELDEKSGLLKTYDLPQPSLTLANNRSNTPAGLKNFGAFYENSRLAVDGQNRPWIVYRHFYAPLVGIATETHKQENARIYARCLLPDGWSKLYSFEHGQGDGMQRISVSPKANGINLAWATGRTDRRDPQAKERGIAIAQIELKDAQAKMPAKSQTVSLNSRDTTKSPAPHVRPGADLAGKHYELFYGDLHRHTDISLCFSPGDGTIEDAYRYGIDAAPLDFLGITDHTHDLAMGDPLGLIWWRTRKEVDRHALGKTFIPFYAYERSRGETDHNVISLRDDMLRPHTYAHAEFIQTLDTNTFMIPHQPFNPVVWEFKDNARRPLLEIYQGFRNDSKESIATEGLMRGHEFGIIASSDHLSTSASFACVWTANFTREGVFRAMQARRTFGATAKIILKVSCGDHWMGEKFSTKKMPPMNIEVDGTDKIAAAEVFVDGKSEKIFQGKRATEKFVFASERLEAGQHIFFVRVKQNDGNMAWASPIWVNIEP